MFSTRTSEFPLNTGKSESAIKKIKVRWEHDWPAEDMESVSNCPVCSETTRTLLHTDLVDNVFHAAPGKWTLWSCAKCRSAYLNPRPTSATMHRAYANYYTHEQIVAKNNYADLSLVRKLRRRLVNGYTNWRYSTCHSPASTIGVIAVMAMWPYKTRLDREYRHLSRLPAVGGTLLDVGCGDGSFLALGRTCGWKVIGLDPDPMAVANAARQSLTVHKGGIEYFEGETELFDVITLNHVIEHVYEPLEVLKRCNALLKPGGELWLETPNIDSFGHAEFQRNWRGLETPRHLVLFNRYSLRQALINAGFYEVKDLPCQSACFGMFRASNAMQKGHSPYKAGLASSKVIKLKAMFAALAELLFPSRREFLTMAARKIER